MAEVGASTTCFSSARLTYIERYQGMPRISIIGVRTDPLVNARPATPLCISFDLEGPIARSRLRPAWVDSITSIGVLYDGLCALQAERLLLDRHLRFT